jgi:cytochrome c oxidase subunit 3/cytochrome c oxidase subunit I+III
VALAAEGVVSAGFVPIERAYRLDELPPDEARGTWGLALTIVTEALLFVSLFFAYFYVRSLHEGWMVELPPKLPLAFVLLGILLVSSGTVELARRSLARERVGAARAWVALTVALGALFVIVQVVETREHLSHLRPTTNAYGSLFYVITSFHGLHVVVGLVMLVFVLFLPRLRPARSPHRSLANAALYWHFVDLVWVSVVVLLYVVPQGGPR